MLLDIVLAVYRLDALSRGDLVDPDSYMRLVRLDDIVAAQVPLDAVARDASGAGTVLHWSHLLDSLLLLMAAPLAPLFGEHAALHWAGVMLGPLGAGLLGAALAWVAAPMTEPEWRWTASVIGILSIPILTYAIPGVVHHHILVALAGIMCAGWAGRCGALGAHAGWNLGVWAAFGLWLSPEAMPVALMAFGAVGAGWLSQPERRLWGAAAAVGTSAFALLTALAFAVDHPAINSLAPDLDRLSVAWLAFALLGAVAGSALWLIDRSGIKAWPRAAAGAAVAALAGIFWLALFPAALSGPEGIQNGAHAHAFDAISEMQPITSIPDALLYLLPGAFAAAIAAILTLRSRSWLFGYATLCVLLLLLSAVLHVRFATYVACAGAASVPIAISLINHALEHRPPIWSTLGRSALLLFLLGTPLAPAALMGNATEHATVGSDCPLREAAPMLQPYAGAITLADVNDTPELLYRTQLQTVGSLYHRNMDAFLRLSDAWRSSQLDSIPPAVSATRASLVLFCHRARRTALVADLSPDTLWDRLNRGDIPAWLHEVAHDAASGYRLFQIEPR